MTKEEFGAALASLEEQKGLDEEIEKLQEQYLDSFGLRVGDKVLYKEKTYYIFERGLGWGNTPRYHLTQPKKDGGFPQRPIKCAFFVRPEELTKIS